MGQGFWIALNLENAMPRPRWPWSCDGRQESGYEPGKSRGRNALCGTTIRQADRWKYRGNCCWRMALATKACQKPSPLSM